MLKIEMKIDKCEKILRDKMVLGYQVESNGVVLHVPVDPANRDYADIIAQQSGGKVSINDKVIDPVKP